MKLNILSDSDFYVKSMVIIPDRKRSLSPEVSHKTQSQNFRQGCNFKPRRLYGLQKFERNYSNKFTTSMGILLREILETSGHPW